MTFRAPDFLLAGGWLLLDQLTKFAAATYLDRPFEAVPVIPGVLRFALSHNRGALFGWLGDVADPWRTLILTGLPAIAIVGITVLLLRTARAEVFARAGLALILGGAIGNVLDRLLYGHVVDFIDLYTTWTPLADRLIAIFGTNRWPTFNIADTGLTCGAALLLYEVFLRRPAPKAAPPAVGAPLGE